MTERVVNISGIISILLMAAMLGLLYFRVVPKSYGLPFFVIAALLLLVRVGLRMWITVHKRKADGETPGPTD